MKIKQLLTAFIVSCLFFVASGFSAVNAGGGPIIYFDPNSATLKKGDNLQVVVKVDTGNPIFGADATVVFSSADLEVKSVANGDTPNNFSNFTYGQSDGRLEIHGFMSYPASKTGVIDLAKITFSAKKDSGTGQISFLCSGGGETQVLNTNGENIFSCSGIGNQLNITYTGSGTSGDSPYPPGYSEPNQCGGTCGSNYNCAAPLFCYNGFCKNTECKDDLTCGCKATPTPVPTKKPTPKPAPKGGATPEVVVLSEFTPLPSSTPLGLSTPEAPATSNQAGGIDLKRVGIVAGAVILALAIIIMLLSRGKKGPPKINPPSQEPINPGPGYPPPPPPQPPPSPFNPPPPQNPPV